VREAAAAGRVMVMVMLGALATVAGCSDPLGPERDALEANRAKWASLGISSYRYEYALNCFCGGPGARPVAVVVQDGVVEAVSYPDSEEAVEPWEPADYPTIDDLFERVEESLDREPYKAWVEYDARYGYPADAYFDFEQNAIDEEFGFVVTEFVVAR
jgi:hypothetical protein